MAMPLGAARNTSRIGTGHGMGNALFFPVPPPVPGGAGFPTSRTPQATYGRLGSEELAVGQGRTEKRTTEDQERKRRRMLQLTSRDEAMLDWMNVVRLADVDAIRWALSAYRDDHDGPVSVRRANYWIARMADLGYLGRMRPLYRDRQIVWPTHHSSGRSAPRLFRQTMRHDLAVSMVSARYLAVGFEWARDSQAHRHQADGIARRGAHVEAIEVELTAKATARYGPILAHFARGLETGALTDVSYWATRDAARVVDCEADRLLFRDLRSRLTVQVVFDQQGRLAGTSSGSNREPLKSPHDLHP
jgi:hypothetical protein